MRNYKISWYVTKDAKYREPVQRTTWIKLDKTSGQTSFDAKMALNNFLSTYGGLNKNTVVKIQEFDENMVQIGEDITPAVSNSIIPVGK